MDYTFTTNLFFEELTTVADERLKEFQMISPNFLKILELAKKAAKEEIRRRSLQNKIDQIQKEAAAKIKRLKKKQNKSRSSRKKWENLRNHKESSLCTH